MSLNNKVGWIACATSAVIAGSALASTTPADTDARIASLEAQIQALKTEQEQSNWLNMNSEELLALQQEVLADSQTQTSLLSAGADAGWDRYFYLSSADGDFRLRVQGQSQFRFVWSHRDEADFQDDDVADFELSRTKLIFLGQLWQDLEFKIQGDFSQNDGNFGLEDAYGIWNLGNGWGLQWGQFKAPVLREELVSSSRQQAVERSYVNELATGGRTQGVAVLYANDEDSFRFWGSFNDGANSENSDFSDDQVEYAFTGRVEAVIEGDGFSQFADLSSFRDDEFGWLLGGAVHWQEDNYGTGADEVETLLWTVDTQVEFGGANIFAYVVGAHGESNDGTTEFDQFGWLVQGGYFLTDDWEIFGRFEWYDFDDVNNVDEFSAVTAGVNWYNQSHAWKWQTDVVYALDPVPASVNGLGLLADTDDNDGQIAFRTQMQFLF
ncbi:MAG: porin [Planctomycetota bacterium]